MGISRGMGIPNIPAGREIPEAREIPESQEFPGNSRVGNSREGKGRSHMGGREWEFLVEYLWHRVNAADLPTKEAGQGQAHNALQVIIRQVPHML